MSVSKKKNTKYLQPKYLTPRDAAVVYGVHRDFFRKTEELRRHRIPLNKRTHVYPVDKLDAFFEGKQVD